MDTNNLNLPLRSQILGLTLNIEDHINKIILLYLDIDKDKRKAMADKSGALTIKNKIDLLSDLEILIDDEYESFLLLFEIRNQFVHSIPCNSYSSIKKEIKNKLIKYCDSNSENDPESILNNSFHKLYRKCLKIIKMKIGLKRDKILEQERLIIDPQKHLIFIMEGLIDIFSKLVNSFAEDGIFTPEILSFKKRTSKFIIDELNELTSSKEYLQSQAKYSRSMDPEKVSSILNLFPGRITKIFDLK